VEFAGACWGVLASWRCCAGATGSTAGGVVGRATVVGRGATEIVGTDRRGESDGCVARGAAGAGGAGSTVPMATAADCVLGVGRAR
jgi:hypothetical protein